MPRLWSETIEAHRREVREAILDTAAHLAGGHGLLNVTMSQIAAETGIGRATLYKYFSSVDEVLRAWHEGRISRHLARLAELAHRDAPASQRLASVLEAYATIQRHRGEHRGQRFGAELAAYLHHDAQLAPAEQQLHDLFRDLLADAAAEGEVRSDVAAGELAAFCRHALDAAGTLPSNAATKRLVGLVIDGLRPPG